MKSTVEVDGVSNPGADAEYVFDGDDRCENEEIHTFRWLSPRESKAYPSSNTWF